MRFKGFTDDWEQRKLGAYYWFKNGINKNKEFFGEGTPIVNYTDVYHHRALTSNLIKGLVRVNKNEIENYSVNKGDVFFTRTSETIREIGYPAVVLNVNPNTVFSGFLIRVRPIKIEPLVPEFKKYIFFTHTFRKEMMKKSSITTRALTSGSNLAQMYINFPNSSSEQNQIGKVISLLDKFIMLQQRKLKLLKLLKKAMLQTLFTDKSIPNLRFISFDKNWDIVKLKDVGKATGGTSIESEFTPIGGTHKVISIGSYKENHTYNDQGIRVNLNDKTQKRVLNKDDLTMILNDKTTSGRIIGSVLLIPVDNVFVYNQRTERIEPNHKKFSSKFLYQYLNSPNIRNKIISNAQGNTQIYVNWSSISKLKYLMPQKKEQDKISKLLFTLDSIINNQQLRIKKYEKFKQFLLQNMFI
nr:restriction endonuclease subunit S [Lactobacillus paragasseri]